MTINHTHDFSYKYAPTQRVLLIAVGLALSLALVEAIAGWWAHALVLLGDAGHMLFDSIALSIAVFAAWVARKPPSQQHSYGLGRAEVLAAWMSSVLMIVVAIIIAIEAIARLKEPHHVEGGIVIIAAMIAVLTNGSIAILLQRHAQNLNIRAAFIHVLGDLLGSLAVLLSGIVIYIAGWMAIDAILSLLVCALILISSLRLLRETLRVLMEGVPLHISFKKVNATILSMPGVQALHDLHIWTLSSGQVMLSAHIEITDLASWEFLLEQLPAELSSKFGIYHITLQPEVHNKKLHHKCLLDGIEP